MKQRWTLSSQSLSTMKEYPNDWQPTWGVCTEAMMKASEKNSREPDTTTLALLRAWSAATSSMFCPAQPSHQGKLEISGSLLTMLTNGILHTKLVTEKFTMDGSQEDKELQKNKK